MAAIKAIGGYWDHCYPRATPSRLFTARYAIVAKHPCKLQTLWHDLEMDRRTQCMLPVLKTVGIVFTGRHACQG